MARSSYAVYVVFADGNPQYAHTRSHDSAHDLTAPQAVAAYREVRARYDRVPPFVGIMDDDDPERGWFDADQLEDEYEALHGSTPTQGACDV